MVRIHACEFFAVHVDYDEARVEIVRSERRFKTLQSFVSAVDDVLRAVESAEASSFALLYDCRRAPSPSSRAYKRAILHMIEHLARRFEPVAFVLSSQAAIEEVLPQTDGHIDFFTNTEAAKTAIRHQVESTRMPLFEARLSS
jgi:hypothetical protein